MLETGARGGFTLIELMIVTVIIGLLAGIAIPKFDQVRERAYDAAALADLHSAEDEIERYFNDHLAYPPDDEALFDEGFALSPGVTFLKFQLSNASDPELAHMHIHIAHQGSPHYFHVEYPDRKGKPPELRWKK
jgi:prepilin-type N-terminal cleavage/methylation domain-containing protein